LRLNFGLAHWPITDLYWFWPNLTCLDWAHARFFWAHTDFFYAILSPPKIYLDQSTILQCCLGPTQTYLGHNPRNFLLGQPNTICKHKKHIFIDAFQLISICKHTKSIFIYAFQQTRSTSTIVITQMHKFWFF
jgi:hypothetical protein